MVYAVPVTFVWFILGAIGSTIRHQLSGWSLRFVAGAIIGIMFVGGGFGEMTVAMQCTLFVIAIIVSWSWLRDETRRRAISLFSAGLVGSAAALVVTLLAPGNAVREVAHPVTRSLISTAFLAAENTAAFIAMQLAFFSLVPIAVCLFLSAMMTYFLQPLDLKPHLQFKSGLRWMGISAAVGAILIMAFLAPAAYGMGKMPASRAWIVPQTVVSLVVVIWGIIIGLSLRKGEPTVRLSLAAVIGITVLLIIGPGLATLNTLSQSSNLRTFATEWDARDQMIRAAVADGLTEVTVKPFTVDLADLANLDRVDDKKISDFTKCVEQYYGIESVVISSET
jgi:hypothetical protein